MVEDMYFDLELIKSIVQKRLTFKGYMFLFFNPFDPFLAGIIANTNFFHLIKINFF